MRPTLYVTLLALLLAWPWSARAGKRVALVVGNGDYQHTAPLKNPLNDASDLADALKRLGFEVILGKDLNFSGMRNHVRRFTRALPGSEISLFFYAGHGLQVRDFNYLAPIDADLTSETDLEFGTVRLDVVLRQMERETSTSIVFLDACRDNPMAANLARSMGSRSANVGRGLARVESGVGTLIAFATQPGNVALDGDGRNSPFTGALVKAIETPGLDLGGVMIEVRNAVLRATAGRQVPWEHSSLTGRVFLAPEKLEEKTANSGDAQKKTSHAVEIAFWESIRDSENARLFKSYLNRYPDGSFSEIAKLRMEELSSASKVDQATAVDAKSPLSTSDEMRALQSHLYELNYDPGPVDGKIGKSTRKAVSEFQSQAGLDVTGNATKGLLKRLRGIDNLKPWGALVYSQSHRDWGMSWGAESRKDALSKAEESCGKSKGCDSKLTFFGTECGAFAYSDNSWSIVARESLKQAKAAALDECKSRGGDCRIIATVCADGAEKQVAAQ